MKVLLLGDEGNGRTVEVQDRRDLKFAVWPDDVMKIRDAKAPISVDATVQMIHYRQSYRLSTRTLGAMVCESIDPESDKAVGLLHNLALAGTAEPTGLMVEGLSLYIAPGQHDDFTARAIATLRKTIDTSEKVFREAVRELRDKMTGDGP